MFALMLNLTEQELEDLKAVALTTGEKSLNRFVTSLCKEILQLKDTKDPNQSTIPFPPDNTITT